MKKELSLILQGRSHKWFPIEDTKIIAGNPYIVRLVDKNYIMYETDDELVYREDIQIARFIDGKWKIEGPFPKMDFSLCSERENLKNGVEVTHIAYPTEDDVNAFHQRYDPIYKYNKFIIDVDDNMVDELYHAIIIAKGCMSKMSINFEGNNEDLNKIQKAYDLLSDMQCVFDRGGDIHAMDN